jgi:hypothetical protein
MKKMAELPKGNLVVRLFCFVEDRSGRRVHYECKTDNGSRSILLWMKHGEVVWVRGPGGGKYHGEGCGEDHEPGVDVKAVSLRGFVVEKKTAGRRSSVMLDV